MTLLELRLKKQALQNMLTEINRIRPNCRDCTKFNGKICNQFDAAPPNEWLNNEIDCEHWEWDCIPF